MANFPHMHPFEQESQQILDALTDAYNKIEAIDNPEMLWLKNKILMDIRRHINSLTIQLGKDVSERFQDSSQSIQATPIKKLFGRDLSNPQPAPAVPVVMETTEQIELKELRTKVDELYPKFLLTEADHLLDSCSDLEIRGVAKRAGLPVTEDNPKKITTKYIDQIKKAIQQQIAATENDNKDK